MALINSLNQTRLRSLKYGGDRPDNGNSNQPYIVTPIPEKNIIQIGTSPDSLVRGGLLGSIKASVLDVTRLTKWFTTPLTNGLLFTAKQIALSRQGSPAQGGTPQAPKNLNVNEGVYTPLSTLAQAGVLITGYHLNKQGNPFTETGAYAKNPNLYFDKAKSSNLAANNYIRTDTIVTQADTFTAPLDTTGTQFDIPFSDIVYGTPNPLGEDIIQLSTRNVTSVDFQNRLASLWYNKIEQKNNDPNVLSYQGGPGSILGFGKTNIRFADQRTGVNNTKDIKGGTRNNQIIRSFNNLDRSPTSNKFNQLTSGSGINNNIESPGLNPPSVYEVDSNNKPNLLKQNDKIFNAQNTYVLSQTQIHPYHNHNHHIHYYLLHKVTKIGQDQFLLL